MSLAVRAWRLREAAREALAAGQLEQAGRYAQEAQAVQWTQAGEVLFKLSMWLAQPLPQDS